MKAILLLVLVTIAVAYAAVPADEITSLPGYNKAFPSKQYSGYLTIDAKTGKKLHYWLVLSENNPATDPVFLWLNGGPGCSSLDGFFYEHGPLHFVNPQAMALGAVPELQDNPYRWNKIASGLFIEAPAGVGFSYSNNPSDYITNDNKTAADNLKALEVFFQSYPELSTNDFYIAGESYAGVYVPTLAEQILRSNEAGLSNINLQGILVGNGCTGSETGVCSPQGTKISVDYLHGVNLYSTATYNAVYAACSSNWANPSPACNKALAQMGNEIGNINVYNILEPCVSGGLESNGVSRVPHHPLLKALRAAGSVGGPNECIDGISASLYLNDAAVRQAIHVADASVIPQWSICTSKISYTSNIPTLLPLYKDYLIPRIRVVVFNGDVDACVPITDNEIWTSSLGLPIAENWRPWLVEEPDFGLQVAGYVTKYATPTNFTFLTVHGAGHMVPQYKPLQAYIFFQKFINNQEF